MSIIPRRSFFTIAPNSRRSNRHMAALQNSTLEAMKNKQAQLLNEWVDGLQASGATRNLKDHDVQQQTGEFLQLVISGLQNDNGTNINAPGWESTRQFLEKLSHSRALLGQDSQRTASFIFAGLA
jgi:rsbT co-antagonist protein RsbR